MKFGGSSGVAIGAKNGTVPLGQAIKGIIHDLDESNK